jgi:hypothetical protein
MKIIFYFPLHLKKQKTIFLLTIIKDNKKIFLQTKKNKKKITIFP